MTIRPGSSILTTSTRMPLGCLTSQSHTPPSRKSASVGRCHFSGSADPVETLNATRLPSTS